MVAAATYNATYNTEWKKSVFTASLQKEKLTLDLQFNSYLLREVLFLPVISRKKISELEPAHTCCQLNF